MVYNILQEVVKLKTVEPIRDPKKIKKVKNILKQRGYRDYLLFSIGINTGLRISDILKLKVKDVKDKSHIILKEGKTQKEKRFFINKKLREDIDAYIFNKEDDDFLFESRKNDEEGNAKAISRNQAYNILRAVADEVELENIGTHSMRKTFGYHHYKKHKDIALLQEIFNHSSPSVTLKYIGINQENQDNSVKEFYL